MSSLLANDPVFFRLRGPVLPPAEEAKKMLGRVVRNFAQPLGDGYRPEDATSFAIGPIVETKWLKASDVFTKSASGFIELRLSGIGGGKAELDGSQSFSLQNSEVLAMELKHQPEVYRKLLSDQGVGQWIRENCKLNNPLFMVTGLLVWRDAIRKTTSSQTLAGDADLKLPSGTAAATAAGLPGVGKLGDLNAAAAGRSTMSREHERENEDSQIFAVEYKVIRRRRRDVLGGFVPALQHRGLAVDVDRQYAGGRGRASRGSVGSEDDMPELVMDLPWVDAIEEGEEASEIRTETAETEGSYVEFVMVGQRSRSEVEGPAHRFGYPVLAAQVPRYPYTP